MSELNLLFQRKRKLTISTQRTFPHMKFHLEKIENPHTHLYQAENFLHVHWPH